MKGKNLSHMESGVQSLSPDLCVKYESLPQCPANADFLFGMSHSLPPLSPLWYAQMPPPWVGTLWHTIPSHALLAVVCGVNTSSPSVPRDLTSRSQGSRAVSTSSRCPASDFCVSLNIITTNNLLPKTFSSTQFSTSPPVVFRPPVSSSRGWSDGMTGAVPPSPGTAAQTFPSRSSYKD